MRRAALFDLDGVVVDSSQFHYESWVKLGEEVGFVMTHDFFLKTFGQRNDTIIRQLVPNATEEQIAEWGARKEELYREVARNRLVPLPGSVDLIFGLKELGFKLAIASSTPRINIAFAIEQLKLGNFFDDFVGAEDVKHGKPSPEVFLKAAEKVGVSPERCVVFEDAVVGVIAAKRGGMKCVAVTTTSLRTVLEDAGADLVVDSLAEVTPNQIASLLEVRSW